MYEKTQEYFYFQLFNRNVLYSIVNNFTVLIYYFVIRLYYYSLANVPYVCSIDII